MQAIVHACTRPSGTHTENEDRALVGDTVLAATTDHGDRLGAPAVLAVMDGLGGHVAGHVASDLTARLVANAEIPRDEQSAAELVQRADVALHDAMRDQPDRFGMGTTIALLALNDGDAIVANVGDSSIWKLTDDEFTQLTVSDRAMGSTIWQCLGASTQGVEPHVGRTSLADGDRLLLASDGLTDIVPPETIEAALRKDVDHAIERLGELVDEAGVPDDLTVIVAELRAE